MLSCNSHMQSSHKSGSTYMHITHSGAGPDLPLGFGPVNNDFYTLYMVR
jgi:hypothetical protein